MKECGTHSTKIQKKICVNICKYTFFKFISSSGEWKRIAFDEWFCKKKKKWKLFCGSQNGLWLNEHD